MTTLTKLICFSFLLGSGDASTLGQSAETNSFEVGFDSVRRHVSPSGPVSDDDPVRRHVSPQSAGARGDGFIHRQGAVTQDGTASLLELGTEKDQFKVHMQDMMAHGMHRHILEYSRHQGWACGTTGNVIDVNMTMVKCKTLCSNDLECTCYQFEKTSSSCSLQKAASCVSENCRRSGSSDVYIQKAVWAKDPLRLVRHQGMDCRDGKGATELDSPESVPSDLSIQKCKERCGLDEDCTCFKWDRTSGQCFKMKECRTRECAKSRTIDTYLQEAVYNGYAQKHSGIDW